MVDSFAFLFSSTTLPVDPRITGQNSVQMVRVRHGTPYSLEQSVKTLYQDTLCPPMNIWQGPQVSIRFACDIVDVLIMIMEHTCPTF